MCSSRRRRYSLRSIRSEVFREADSGAGVTVDRYPSVPERITWTTGFRVTTDKAILGALSTFANFRTGKAARMSIQALTMRSGFPRRTVERALQRLEADGWIVAHRYHRHATSWDINVDRLAENWVGAKVVSDRSAVLTDLTATGGGQEDQTPITLTATGGGQDPDLTATGGGQDPDLTATGGGPIPCTSVIPCRTDHKEPALRAVRADTFGTTTPTLFAETEAKVDAAKSERAPPEQLTFGPQDVTAAAPDPNWRQRLADTIRAALRQTGERKKQHG